MKTIKKILIAVFLIVSCTGVYATKGYNIKLKIDGLKDTTVLLANHFGSKKYVVDTFRVDNKGAAVLTGDSLLHGGMYLIILPTMSYFEILIDKDQDFSLETDTVNLVQNMKVTGSDDNQHFFEYQLFMIEQQKKRAKLNAAYKKHGQIPDSVTMSNKEKEMHKDSAVIIKEQLLGMDSIVNAEWERIIAQNPTGILAAILRCLKEVEVPEAPMDENGVILDSLFRYKYFTNHFFEGVDFGDKRLLRTPFLESKIKTYFSQSLKIPDTICVEIDKIVERSRKEPEVFRYIVQYFFNEYNNPKIMGMDRVFVHISEKYYLSGEATWALNDTAFINKVKDRVVKQKPNLLGEIAPDMKVYDLALQNYRSLHGIQADYVVLYFFEPSCGHCKKIIPKWHQLYQENNFAEKNIKTVLMYTQVDQEPWKEFIEKHQLHDVLNVYDPYQVTNFRNLYDIYSTPVPYILDKDKKIVAKRISAEQIADYLNKMVELEQKKK